MATENERLVTEAKLKTAAPGIVENAETGRRALVFPSGTVEVGDTGWVDIQSEILNGWTASAMMVRRRGNTTRVRFTNLNSSAATSNYFVRIPAGYMEPGGANFFFPLGGKMNAGWANNRQLSISLTESVTSSTPAEIVIQTDETWPSTLGGPQL